MEPLVVADDLVVRTVLPGASRLSTTGHRPPDASGTGRIALLHEDYFAEKTSLISVVASAYLVGVSTRSRDSPDRPRAISADRSIQQFTTGILGIPSNSRPLCGIDREACG